MKRLIGWTILGMLCCLQVAAQTPEKIVLNTEWEFAQAGEEVWRPATVPGTVHQDLLDNILLPNPFYGMNEEKVQWVEQKDWKYRTRFILTAEQMKHASALLTFEGVDTYADIYLNGALLKSTDNMFVGYTLPVKEVLREGENHLQIYFHSPIKKRLPQWETNGFDYPADNDHSTTRVSIYSRKAPYSYGWDWGIRLATSGIWKPVTLTFGNKTRIKDYYVRQASITPEKACIDNILEIENTDNQEVEAQIWLSHCYQGDTVFCLRQIHHLKQGVHTLTIPSEIENPHLWMPNGWGEPALHDFDVTVTIAGTEVAAEKKRIGLREVRVVMEDDADGKSFYFMVNGKPMFAKGANLIPNDALLPNMTRERYYRLMQDIRDANMNLVRVWGGGIYENNALYEAADEMGILIWQDFIFACTTYPSDPDFLRRVSEEAEYNLKRLRNHASLAMWCGNNEIYEGMRYWGWSKKYNNPQTFERMKEGYNQLFHQLLPKLVKQYDDTRFYMHSSPYEANWGRPESWKIADSHNWGIWYGQKAFESLDTEIPRFMSEYGFQAFPEMKTIQTFASPDDYALESDVMNAHQKATIGNALIKKTMALYYDVPEKFEDLVYQGLVLQGRGVRQGIEAHRRHRPYCMGSLYWQLNDSWPVVSWSSIDYYGNWKALHYQARRAFAPILLNAFKEGDKLNIYLISDRLTKEEKCTLRLTLMDFDGKVLSRKSIPGEIPANATTLYHQELYADMALQPTRSLLSMVLTDRKGNVVSENIYYFCYPKEQALPTPKVSYRIKQEDGKCEITLSSKQLVRDVFIEVPPQGARFSDNFFDLLPGQRKKVIVTSDKIRKDTPLDIKIRHLKAIIK